MIEIEGRQILTTLAEKVDPKYCAVLHIDMQKDFTTRDFFWDQLGQLDIEAINSLADRLKVFLDAARGFDVPIFHIKNNYDPQFMNDPMHERLYRHGVGRYCQSGTEGVDFHEGLEPHFGEPVVVKHRFDAFFDTDLHIQLQAKGIRTIISTGIAVHGCVDSTTRHAYFHGYYTVFGADLAGGASPEVHQMTLDSMNLMFGVTASAAEITEAWKQPSLEDQREGAPVATV
jgi:ureidoacrylate peracid hydrolase